MHSSVGSETPDTVTNLPKKQPTLDDVKSPPPVTTQPKTNPTPKTQPKEETKPVNGCRAAGIQFNVGQTTAGCMGPGKTEPTANQCLAAIMPVWKCESGGGWTCVTNCQHNYY